MTDSPAPTRRPRRRRALTPTPAMLAGCPPFEPVPRTCPRHDGWTAERQRAFIVGLMATGSVRLSCERIGMASEGAYMLRRQPGAEDFARAWAQALTVAVETLEDVAMERARHGVPVPVFHKGEQVGEKRWYNDRLLIWALRHHAPDRYATTGSAAVTPQTRKALFKQWEEERAARIAAERRSREEADAARLTRDLDFRPADAREREWMLDPRNILAARLMQMHERTCADPRCDRRDADGTHTPFAPRDPATLAHDPDDAEDEA